MSKREKVLLAVLGSVVAHAVILLLLALGMELRPAAAATVKEQPLTVRVIEEEEEATPEPPPLLAVEPPRPTPPPMIPTTDRQASARPPEKPAFQSDKDTRAAGEMPPTGAAPMPSQEGRQTPAFAFDTQVYTPGDKPAAAAAAAVDTTPPKPQVNRTAPRPTPAPTPEPAPPEPAPEAPAAPDEFALLAPTPTPKPWRKRDDPTPFDPYARQDPARPQPLAPGATRPPLPGFQPQTTRSQISGSISNRGVSAVAALGTPLGRYQKAIADAVGSRWYMYIAQHSDLPINGAVKVHFIVQRSGRVRSAQIVSQTGTQSLGTFSVGAVMDATIPPIPEEVQQVLNHTEMEIDFNFYTE